VDTSNIAGRIPGATFLRFNFVPEPGTMLLLVSGAVGLAVIGRRRLRK
jgi:PEP-CTERM motif